MSVTANNAAHATDSTDGNILANPPEKSTLDQITTLEMAAKVLSEPTLFSEASNYARMRHLEGVWQFMVYDLLERQNHSVKRIAGALCVSPRTIKRILGGQTSNPSIRTSKRLHDLHSMICPEGYQRLLTMLEGNNNVSRSAAMAANDGA